MAHFAKLGANGKVIQVLTFPFAPSFAKCAIMFLLIY